MIPPRVLTPAVYAATRAARRAAAALPFIWAFIANAASFTLPISNPANLVVFGGHMPPLLAWLSRFGLASLVSIGVTYLVLRLSQRRALATARIACDIERPPLRRADRWPPAPRVLKAHSAPLSQEREAPVTAPCKV